MQAAGHLVGILVEFAAGVQLRHHHFGRRHAFRMHAGRNAAAIVTHGARAVRIERDVDLRGVSGERFVDGVVDGLVHHVMQTGSVIGVADIHAGTLAHGVESLKDLDRLGAIIGVVGADIFGRFKRARNGQEKDTQNESD